ncbi:MAG: hypothetical protein HC859_07325 [Bacteroidia bacterium]|nr:hypothetical protein [Bacteroidia bacterium]
MIIFINDIPLRIFKQDEMPEPGSYNHAIDAAVEPITQSRLIHHVWINHVDESALDVVLGFLNSKVPTNVFSVSISVDDYDRIKAYFKSKFKVVMAAGGLIRKKEKVSHDIPPEEVGPAQRKEGEAGTLSRNGCAGGR